MSKRRRYPKNNRPWKGGWQTYVQVHGHTHHLSWPITATIAERREWVEQQKRDGKIVGPKRGSFAADVTDYLSRMVAIRSYDQFAAYLEDWMKALGRDRPRRGITPQEIDQTMQQWERDGVNPPTLRKRRTAFMSLWNRLDGKDAPNPLRSARVPQAAKPEARAIPYPTIIRIMEALPERTAKQRARKRRLVVIAFTGIPPGMLASVTPADLNLKAKTVRLRPRRKGRGVEARTLPLIPDGVAAFNAFHLAGDYGPFREDDLNRAFKQAASSIGVHGVTVYDLRHSFATALYLETKDLDTVARFLQHSSIALTQRYAKAALGDVDKAAAAALGRSLSRKPVPKRKRSRKRR